MRQTIETPVHRFIAFIFTALVTLFIVGFGLAIPLISGLLAYQTVILVAKRLVERFPHQCWENVISARAISAAFLIAFCAAVMAGLVISANRLFPEGASVHDLLRRAGEVVESFRAALPEDLARHIPTQAGLLSNLAEWLKGHAVAVGSFGLTAVKHVGLAMLGLILGSLAAVSGSETKNLRGPVEQLLRDQCNSLRLIFWQVASAQVIISTINTACTAIYLYAMLPATGVDLKLRGALVITTFIVGLVPVVGNLLANTAMTVISLDHSGSVAIISLGYLMLVHKLEYVWTGRIIGHKVDARVWEILLAMLVFEHLLGLPGLAMGPVLYAWGKSECLRFDRRP